MSSTMSRGLGRMNNRSGEQMQAARQRPITRSTPQPPPLDLQVPLSQSSRSTSTTRGARSMRSGGSQYSPSPSRESPIYGSQTTLSPLTLSPDSLSQFGDPTSASLPASLSALASNPELELVSPASIGTSRSSPSPRTLSPAQRPHASSSPRLAGHLSHSNLRIHTSNTTRSAPISRKPSATSLDRDAGVHLDMKRLLSKPAQSSHSGSSIVSMPSDLEFAGGNSQNPRHPRSSSHQVQPSQRFVDASPIRRATDSPKTLIAVSNNDHQSHVIKSSAPKGSSGLLAKKEAGSNQPQRNVLRRRSSTHSNSATPTAATFKVSNIASAVRSSSSKVQRSATPRRAASATAEPVSLASLRRNQEPPSHLTPAGAVVHAYKQQEQRREQLAEMVGSADELRHGSSSNNAQQPHNDDEEEGGIYYTVFGSSVGRVVAVGSEADSSWDLSYEGLRSRRQHTREGIIASSSSSTPGSIPSRLGRKISGRFKKTSTGLVKHGRDQSPYGSNYRQLDEPFDGRPSISERRTVTSAVTSGRAPSTSVDGFVDIRAALAMPSVRNGSPEKHDGEQRHKEGKTLRSVKSVIGKDKDTDKESSPGSKLQKLIKRFSSAGGLRDRYTREVAPPVPALPKDYQLLPAPSRLTFDIKAPGRQSPIETSVSRFMQSRSSLSGVRPSTAPQQQTSRKEPSSSRPSTGARPSTTTRSSSPMSSDMASVHFSKPRSTRSSISSYGAELLPLSGGLEQHILSPSELAKLQKESEAGSSQHQPKSATSPGKNDGHGSDSGIFSLPPPRRQESYRANSSPARSFPPSPAVPNVNIKEPVDDSQLFTLSRLSLPTSEFGILDDSSPPPRPPRSSRRKPPPTDLSSPTSITPISPPMPPTPRTPRSPNVPKINVSVTRASMGAGSSPYSPSNEGPRSSPASSTTGRSPMRFREIEPAAIRMPLTEEEKRAKWDDLLMRSDEAGGTLHIGESGLMSDNVRFSAYSQYSEI